MKRTAAALLALFALSPLPFSPADAQSQPSAGPTQSGFENPPDSAKPRAWWHWLSGNVTEPGITADLEWMKRVNIAGFQMFDGDLGSPLFVDKPLIWMQPDWKSAWHHAAAEADRLHLEMSMAASGGWSETAGPWVKPEQGMKKYVWSETEVDGPKAFAAVLPAPPRNLGKFQDMTAPPPLHFPAATDLPGAKPQPPQPPRPPVDPYYADVAVRRVSHAGRRAAGCRSAPDRYVECGRDRRRKADGRQVLDGGDGAGGCEAIKSGWVQFAFQQPFRARAVTIGFAPAAAFSGGGLLKGEVQASDDGNSWKTLATLPGPREAASVPFPIRTLTFPETTAKYFRVVAEPVRPNPMLASLGIAPPPREIHFTEIEFASTPRVAYWEDKASFGLSAESVTDATPDAPAAGTIKTSDVIDLTSKMRPDGTLDWQVPAGKWTILRLGYSLTGEVNHPATPAATGLEVDKLSRKDVESYVEQYTKMISDVAGPYFGKSFQYFLMDSWEAGQENWTEQMMAEFRKRRGYDMTPYLPVLTGRVVGSAAASDAFLWDFRRTIADMLAENHYAVAAALFQAAWYRAVCGGDGDGPADDRRWPAEQRPSHDSDGRILDAAAGPAGQPAAQRGRS